ncbi:M14 family zinc carboxypeptidase [Sphingomonas sp. CROZ-RG-20F-R02-07]|uniref:M14 family zinc carboxypeptidase n=1 Tax=Sphingomonas sp. CROZ-RG-20F-R02-07 TaxID=2914832 RepID=UPI001F57BA58|nr:M14 family zinc carboxypeptidase [Sphingomonas sp. CROZ-RG-20F-R02-07]
MSTVVIGAPVAAQTAAQPQDAEYTRLIRQYLTDKRISTELVDHMPASDSVPSPLKFFGRIPGTPGELTYATDIERYYRELARTSPRVRLLQLGTSEEGRNMVALVVADADVLRDLDRDKVALAALGDPRRTSEAQARELIRTAKPIYWITSGIHSPETGGPETLIELAYRLAVEDTPFIDHIRKNVITFITPVVEVDGREKIVDNYYYGKKTGKVRPPNMYWGKYVAHDDNRDGMGQVLKLTQNITRGVLDWHPTVLHDLHEARSYLYVSTGTGPYNPSLSPLQTQEWWQLAQAELTEMSKRNVPGVWTYGFYDGWVPNYLFWIANTHNSLGRFYEVESYGPDLKPDLKLEPVDTSHEWYRPNPPLPSIRWGPRNSVNIQESGLLFALHRVADDRALYLENYWIKNRQSIETGRTGAVNAWVIPAAQHASGNVAEMINDLRRQGVEVSRADAAFSAGGVAVAPGDYVIRADQPYRTLADMYFAVQSYPATNPRPYDDTGWTMQYMRNVRLSPVKDASVLTRPMTLMTADAVPPGGLSGTGGTVLIADTGDTALVGVRFRLKGVRMLAAEAPFEAGGKHYPTGSFILPAANRASVESVLATLGLRGEAVAAVPAVATHELTAPRIGFLHSWVYTQDEGWWRAALDHYGIPYSYFADTLARRGRLRAKYDVLIYPTVGSGPRDQIVGVPMTGKDPIPYKKTALTPNLGVLDSADDIRGGLGPDGLAALQDFVRAGGTLLGDGSTVELLASFGAAPGVSIQKPSQLYTKGALMRGVFADRSSPLVYGYAGKEMPIYFGGDPVMTVGATARDASNTYFDPNGPGVGVAQNTTPNMNPAMPAPFERPAATSVPNANAAAQGVPPAAAAEVPKTPPGPVSPFAVPKPRVVMEFPAAANDILLSGLLSGGQVLAKKPLLVDVTLGHGHMVLYALRPFWRWQTQGSYRLAFNALLNWNHLDAGAARRNATATGGE